MSERRAEKRDSDSRIKKGCLEAFETSHNRAFHVKCSSNKEKVFRREKRNQLISGKCFVRNTSEQQLVTIEGAIKLKSTTHETSDNLNSYRHKRMFGRIVAKKLLGDVMSFLLASSPFETSQRDRPYSYLPLLRVIAQCAVRSMCLKIFRSTSKIKIKIVALGDGNGKLSIPKVMLHVAGKGANAQPFLSSLMNFVFPRSSSSTDSLIKKIPLA